MNAAPALVAPEVSRRRTSPPTAPRASLLIVSDSTDRLATLRASLGRGEIEVTGVTDPEEAARACRAGPDLVVVDVGPEHLIGVLKDIRAGTGPERIPVLVEAGRLAAAPNLAGALLKYRAMPCGRADLIKLARCRITPGARGQRAGKLL
ncbi:MAG TPA: hypothetical protein VFD58_37040 [Blastocatellia bacterium]|nr:hypothetical protein [Blastocatellia bacterium]